MKYFKEEIWQVQTEMFDLNSWIRDKTKKKDLKCPECKRLYEEIGEKVALMTLHEKPNTHLCNDCGRKYIEVGAIDISKQRSDNKIKKEALIKEILSMKQFSNIKEISLKELEEMLPDIREIHNKEVERQRLIKESQPSKEDWEIEQYLIDQYDVYQDEEYLTSEYQIKENFSEYVSDYFDCGQGYYEDEAVIIVKIGKRFFEVTIKAEIGNSWQAQGDKLYFVEKVESVKYIEIDKPKKKEKVFYEYSIEMKEKEKVLLDEYMNKNKIKFKGGD